MYKRLKDKLTIVKAVLFADRVVLITLKSGQFLNYLKGEEYISNIMFNSMLEENAKEIILNLSEKVDKEEIKKARNNNWGIL